MHEKIPYAKEFLEKKGLEFLIQCFLSVTGKKNLDDKVSRKSVSFLLKFIAHFLNRYFPCFKQKNFVFFIYDRQQNAQKTN